MPEPINDMSTIDIVLGMLLTVQAVVSEMPEDARERVLARLRLTTTTISEGKYQGADGAHLFLQLATQLLSASRGMTADALFELLLSKPRSAN